MTIQSEFLELQKITFPHIRGSLSVVDYLSHNIYPKFLKIIKKINCLNNDYYSIKELCDSIVQTLRLYNNGKLLSSYIAFYEAMDKVHNRLYSSYIDDFHCGWSGYNRVRKCSPDNSLSALEMLHLPFTKREKAPAARFSLPGTPCSYMSLQDCLAWLECDSPKNFSLMKIEINPTEKQQHKLLRLNFRPHMRFRIDGFNNKTQEQIKVLLTDSCYTLPIISACSFVCKHGKASFKEEYYPSAAYVLVKRNKIRLCRGDI